MKTPDELKEEHPHNEAAEPHLSLFHHTFTRVYVADSTDYAKPSITASMQTYMVM